MNKEQWNIILCNPVFSLEEIILFLCTNDEHADILYAFSADTGEQCSGIQDFVTLLSIAECRSKLTKLFRILYFACETKQISVTHVFGVDNANIKNIYESLIIISSIEQNEEDIASGKLQVSDVFTANKLMREKLHDACSNVLFNMGNLEHSSINPKEFVAYLYRTSGNLFVPPALMQALHEQTGLPICQPAAIVEIPAQLCTPTLEEASPSENPPMPAQTELRTPTLEEALKLAGGWCACDPENKALRVGLLLMQGRKTHSEIYNDVMGDKKEANSSRDVIKRAIQYRSSVFLKFAQEKGYNLRQYVKR